MAIVGGPDVNRLAGLDIRAKRDELAVSIEAVTPRAPSGKDAAGDEAAEVAHHQRREFGRGARSARRRAVGVDIDALELVDAIFEIIAVRSEEHTSEPQSLMRISYAVFCLKKKNKPQISQDVQ